MRRAAVVVLVLLGAATGAEARTRRVDDDASLRRALTQLKPGHVLRIAPGTYRGGHHLVNIQGTAKRPIEIRGADPAKRPLFEGGGSTAFQLSDCRHVVLADLHVRGFPGNGINVDDGGSFDTPTAHIRLEGLLVENTGPKGNHDALKLSGLVDFQVRRCAFRGWGGSGVDMVGCARGVVDGCTFEGRRGHTQSNGVQMKGGTHDIRVVGCTFRDCGDRGINLGGSTALAYFRPEPTRFEAWAIRVEGNLFHGGRSAVGFVTADRGVVTRNTILYPERWAFRILQESKDERFGACRGGEISHNLIVFDERLHRAVNVGPGTSPETFTFRHNAWLDTKGSRAPRLPTEDAEIVLQPKAEVVRLATGRFVVQSADPRLEGIGRRAYRPGRDDDE